MNILLSSDLDRTILPNGSQPESPHARDKLGQLSVRPEVTLAYVSGRHELLIREAISQYRIPTPDYAIGDVGTSIYEIRNDDWHLWPEWLEAIVPDWNGAVHSDLVRLFSGFSELRLQEPDKQNSVKLSYYVNTEVDHDALIAEMNTMLEKQGVNASLIWSVDEVIALGLLDVLPASATKFHAIKFLIERKRFNPSDTVFAGDSGNDLPVITSGEQQSVLVKNAHPDVVETAIAALREKNAEDMLYVAKGGFLGMNGNYSAGVLEGMAHFLPAVRAWLQD